MARMQSLSGFATCKFTSRTLTSSVENPIFIGYIEHPSFEIKYIDPSSFLMVRFVFPFGFNFFFMSPRELIYFLKIASAASFSSKRYGVYFSKPSYLIIHLFRLSTKYSLGGSFSLGIFFRHNLFVICFCGRNIRKEQEQKTKCIDTIVIFSLFLWLAGGCKPW